jgi:hypothetical protein
MTHPKVFYKYLSAEGTENVLQSGRLRWSSPLRFDDPGEFQRIPRFNPSLEQAGSTFVGTLVNLAAGGLRLDEERLSCLNAIIYTKRAEWRYQSEWRAVTWRTDEGGALYGDYQFYDAELASVTVGAEASDSWASMIRHLVATRYPMCEALRDHGRLTR